MTKTLDASQKILSDIIIFMKYAKHLPHLNRRENWEELIDRNKGMHLKKFPEHQKEIEDAYKFVYDKKILPSMRMLQFSGKPIEINNTRGYNCCFLPVDDWRAFSEIMFLLLGGTGVGFSVQSHDIEKLPEINKPNPNHKRRYLVGDSIEGWADAVKVLMKSYFFGGSTINFDFNDIRQKGARLLTSGGKAPGPDPLKMCLLRITSILDAKQNGDKLSSLEVHDIICFIADAVLAGGIRRAALISLFSADDEKMLSAKAGNWWELNPQRGRANNSAVLLRHKITKDFFMNLWKTIEFSNAGEPGFFFLNEKEHGTNPSLRKGTKVMTSTGIFPIEDLEGKEFIVKNLNGEESKAKCFLSGKNKTLYKITLASGFSYFSTAEHKWPVLDEKSGNFVKVETTELKVGDRFPILKQKKLFDGKIGDYEDGFFAGWLTGDGWITIRGDNGAIQHGMVVSDKDALSGIDKKLENYLTSKGSNAKFQQRDNGTKEVNTQSRSLNENTDKLGIKNKREGIPTIIWNKATEDFRKGFIDGLYSSDGSVEKKTKNSNGRICLSSAHKKLLEDVGEMLGFYGIKTTIRSGKTLLNGKYFDYHHLRISDNASKKHFRDTFKLTHKDKQQRIDEMVFREKYKNSNTIKIKSIEKTEIKEDVWDISVFDKTHCFQISHCITGNCGEILLKPFQFCNLVEINASDLESQQDFENRVRAATILGTLQASYTDFHYLRPIWRKTTEKEALIGIGMTGIASGKVLELDMTKASKIALQENERFAKLLGINKAARLTCVKPAGCQTKDTLVSTQKGILSLEEIGDVNGSTWQEHNLNVYTDAGVKNSTKFFVNGRQKTKHILLSSGLTLKSTPNHKFRVLREENYVWVKAEEIKEGDKLPYSLGEYSGGEYQKLNHVDFVKHKMNFVGKEIKQPEILTEDLAWLIGFYFGDGSNHKAGIRIHGDKRFLRDFDKALRITEDVFGIEATMSYDVRHNGCSMNVNSRQIIPFLKSNNLSKEKSKNIKFPKIIRMSPKSVIKSFIDGYFSADGCEKTRGRSFCTTSKEFAETLVVASRAVGIDSKMRKMPPTQSSFGKNMRYWVSERKGRDADISKIKKSVRDDWSILDSLGKKNMGCDQVISIKDAEDDTFDLEVNDENHTYLSNSYVSHNTTSCVLGTSSGIHAWHSKFYLRRMRVGKNEAIYSYLLKNHPEILEDDYFRPHDTAIIALPQRAPEGAITRDESALDLLARVKKVSLEWVIPGSRPSKGNHNVSATITIDKGEWEEVGEWMWNNKETYSGLSVLPKDYGSYIQPPFEDITEEKYHELFARLHEVNLDNVVEIEDETDLKGEVACAGGACEIK